MADLGISFGLSFEGSAGHGSETKTYLLSFIVILLLYILIIKVTIPITILFIYLFILAKSCLWCCLLSLTHPSSVTVLPVLSKIFVEVLYSTSLVMLFSSLILKMVHTWQKENDKGVLYSNKSKGINHITILM